MKRIRVLAHLLMAIVATASAAGVPRNGLILDLDADKDVEVRDGKVVSWKNQVEFTAHDFKATRDDGRPSWKKSVEALRGHGAVVFLRQELINDSEDAFDKLITGSGYTWVAVMTAYKQHPGLQDVNSFFGNLRNSGLYEGFWGCLNDDGSVWIGSRNGVTFGRWNPDNPKVQGPKLDEGRYHVVAGRMGAGTEKVTIELFVNDSKPAASAPFPVNPKANSSRMAIGQERDATNHPGKESFEGELARFLIWDRPLTDAELAATLSALRRNYSN